MKPDKIKNRIDEIISSDTDNPAEKSKNQNLSLDIDENLKMVQDILGMSDDTVIRRFKLGNELGIKAALVFIDGLVDKQTINESILQPLLIEGFSPEDAGDLSTSDMIEFIEENTMTINEMKIVNSLEKVIDAPLDGDTVLLIDKYNRAIVMNSKGWEKRGVSEPQVESGIRAPRAGFTETLRVNTALIRRGIKHPALRIKQSTVGNLSRADVAVCYIEGVTNKFIVEEVMERIHNVNIDRIQSSGYIEQLIEDNHYSLFPQMMSTERPDKVIGKLLEGRICIIVDGSPFALTLPVTITSIFQSGEDYYERFIIATPIRLLRFFGAIISLTLPSIYIAIIAFHPEMIPTQLALAFAGGRAMVPFPSYLEAFMMETVMELLREASVRLPNQIGQTIGIVGALIIGQAAVSASIVSPFMIIVTATTVIASFSIPDYSSAIAFRLLKYPLMLATTIFGFYGLFLGLITISVHLAGLKSFGVPYLTPFAPSRLTDLKDSLIRAPHWLMFRRPIFLRSKNEQRFSGKGDDDQNERTR